MSETNLVERPVGLQPNGLDVRAEAPRTYVNDAGEEKRDRRRRDRTNDDERIEHLFTGFDNMIQNADEYGAGYLRAMRQEFGQLISELVR